MGEQLPGGEEKEEASDRITTSESGEGEAPRSRARATYDLTATTDHRELETRRKAGGVERVARGLRANEGEQTLVAR